jgi:hypothetical protein
MEYREGFYFQRKEYGRVCAVLQERPMKERGLKRMEYGEGFGTDGIWRESENGRNMKWGLKMDRIWRGFYNGWNWRGVYNGRTMERGSQRTEYGEGFTTDGI